MKLFPLKHYPIILLIACFVGGFAFPACAQSIFTIAGTGATGATGDGGAATAAQLFNPTGLASDTAGNIYIADQSNQKVRKISRAGIITTIAGNGTPGFSGDSHAATDAQLYDPLAVAVDRAGNVYIADGVNCRIRKVNTSGVITTVAGADSAGFTGDGGAATNACLRSPYSVFLDSAGNIFIADQVNNRIRKVNTAGIITTIAGNGRAAYSGDGGPATSAALNSPSGVVVDGAGNVYISDQNNNRIRKIDTAGYISTFIDSGLHNNWGIALDDTGCLYIANYSNTQILKATPTGRVSIYAGAMHSGFSGDGGPATAAQLNYPSGVALGGKYLYIADQTNHRIRRINTCAPNVGSIIGPGALCAGNTVALEVATTGGTWLNANPGIGTISAAGIYTAATGGADTISYEATNTCGTTESQKIIYVQTPDAAGSITGPSSVCIHSSATYSTSGSMGSWYSSSPSVATVVAWSGSVSGLTTGTDTIKYVASNSCGYDTAHVVITVVATPPVVPPVTGPDSVCAGYSIALADSLMGGTWASRHTTIASINASGLLSGIVAGIDTIIYKVTNGCGSDSVAYRVVVKSGTGCHTFVPSLEAIDANIETDPNPCYGTLNIRINSTASENCIVCVYDLTGNKIAMFTAATNINVPLSISAKPGIYLLQTIVDRKLLTKRFVVE